MTQNRAFRIAILMFMISASLHVLAPFLSGFHRDGLMLAAMLPVFLVMIWGLARGWRWFAYLCFFIGAIGGIVALSFIWSENSVPPWIYTGILVADWGAAGALFLALWQAPQEVEA